MPGLSQGLQDLSPSCAQTLDCHKVHKLVQHSTSSPGLLDRALSWPAGGAMSLPQAHRDGHAC